mmetsp:Transcript_121227/g.338355  ORF Transcript_121227/g.338355 Transcript_121227/m.338355 type:complete len:119 (-) Transcript_121227:231-587(-)
MPIMREALFKEKTTSIASIGEGPIEEWVAMPGGGFQRCACDMPALLQEADLLHLYEQLISEDLAVLYKKYDDLGREAFLNAFLRDYLGIAKLTDRQFLANAIARAKRTGSFGAPKAAE